MAYLTIEHKGPIPAEFRTAIGNRVFGCDDCLAVCPWNKFAAASRDAKLAVRSEIDDPPLADLLALDDARFRALFAGTPVKRTGRDRFLRNVAIAAGNSGDPALLPALRALLDDASPLVRGAAVWAFARLAGPNEFTQFAQTAAIQETDPMVSGEWAAAAAPPPPDSEDTPHHG